MIYSKGLTKKWMWLNLVSSQPLEKTEMTPDEIQLGCKKGHISKSQTSWKNWSGDLRTEWHLNSDSDIITFPSCSPPHSKLTKKLPQLRPRLGRRRCRTQIRFPLPGLMRRVARLSARRHLVDKLITALYPTSCLIAGQLPADKLLQ